VLAVAAKGSKDSYDVTLKGSKALEILGIDLHGTRTLRRRFAFPCLDWSERRPHIGGAMGAAVLNFMLNRKWVTQDLNSRALSITIAGRREMLAQFGLQI
jgi:hypothetical protein